MSTTSALPHHNAPDGRGTLQPALPWDNPPRRPLSSSWQVSRTNPVRPESWLHQTAMVERVLSNDAVADGGEKEVEEETHIAQKVPTATDRSKLFDLFCSSFPNGTAPVANLPDLFEAIGLTVTVAQVEEALAVLGPQATATSMVSFECCHNVLLHLHAQTEVGDQEKTVEDTHAGNGWIVGLSDKASTHLLLGVVVVICFLSAFLACGVAVLLLALDDTQSAKRYLQENLGIVRDTLEVYAGQISVQEVNERQAMYVNTIASILQIVAYSATVDEKTQQLLQAVNYIATTLGTWSDSFPQQSFIHYASLVAALVSFNVQHTSLNATVGLFNDLNSNLPYGYEVLLGRWQANATSTVEYLTHFLLADQCYNACATDGDSATPMKAALSGVTAANQAMDYREASVFTGYTSVKGLGVQVNVDFWALVFARFQQMIDFVSTWAAAADSRQYLFGIAGYTGHPQLLSVLPNCDAACLQEVQGLGMPLYRAVSGETGTMAFRNHRGGTTVAAFAPLATRSASVGLVVQMDFSDVISATLQSIVSLVDRLNSQYAPAFSEEFELLTFSVQGNATNFTHLSAYRYGDQCPSGQCQPATEYAARAAQNCSTGVLRTTDYRGVPVVAGYACIAELNAVLALKLDIADVDKDTLAAMVEAVNDRSAKDSHTSAQYLVATPKPGRTASQVAGYGDFDVVTKLKYPESCAHPNCSWNRESALQALEDAEDVIDTTDYRSVAVLAAAARSMAIGDGIGLAVELDHAEAFRAMVDTIVRVVGFTVGIVVGCTAVLVFVTKLFLQSMIAAQEEGKRAVAAEKDRFSKLVAAMYPPFVVPGLLAGDKQLVCEVAGAAVFFSDIHEFTSASNTLASKELLQLMGYVYKAASTLQMASLTASLTSLMSTR
eukprot:EG_transcript_876